MPIFGDMEVTVDERPFGMNVKRGSNVVQEVFAGFAAQRVGVRKGCEIKQIAGHNVSQGTWMDVFQHTKLPFSLKLLCAKKHELLKKGGKGAASQLPKDEHNYQVVVKERPFGMNVQIHDTVCTSQPCEPVAVPYVEEVLPGYPAEAAGVKHGFVLTHIDGKPVHADNWLDIWSHESPAGTVLTFDTTMTTNHHVSHDDHDHKHDDEATDLKEGYSDFRCAVKKLPFGFEIHVPKGKRPTVKKVSPGSPADHAGVKAGDVLIGVAGLPVVAKSWFKSFQQAVPPFGLHFRRPDPNSGASAPETKPQAEAAPSAAATAAAAPTTVPAAAKQEELPEHASRYSAGTPEGQVQDGDKAASMPEQAGDSKAEDAAAAQSPA
jgi:hypothetical protein